MDSDVQERRIFMKTIQLNNIADFTTKSEQSALNQIINILNYWATLDKEELSSEFNKAKEKLGKTLSPILNQENNNFCNIAILLYQDNIELTVCEFNGDKIFDLETTDGVKELLQVMPNGSFYLNKVKFNTLDKFSIETELLTAQNNLMQKINKINDILGDVKESILFKEYGSILNSLNKLPIYLSDWILSNLLLDKMSWSNLVDILTIQPIPLNRINALLKPYDDFNRAAIVDMGQNFIKLWSGIQNLMKLGLMDNMLSQLIMERYISDFMTLFTIYPKSIEVLESAYLLQQKQGVIGEVDMFIERIITIAKDLTELQKRLSVNYGGCKL